MIELDWKQFKNTDKSMALKYKPMAKKQNQAKEGFNEILLYTTPNGKVKVEIYLQNETIWLTQQKMAELFGKRSSPTGFMG